MTEQLKVLERVSIADLTPLLVGKQLLGQITSLNTEKEKSPSGEETEYYKGILADSTGCIEFKLVKDKVLKLSVGQNLRIFNFRTKFQGGNKIYLAVDRFGNVVEEKNEKVIPNTKNNISNDVWEPDEETAEKK
jgi:hypothetical protein